MSVSVFSKDTKPEFLMRVESYQAVQEVTSAKHRGATLTGENQIVASDVAPTK